MMRVAPVMLVLFVLMACGDSEAGERTTARGHAEAAPDVVESDALEGSAADDLEDDPEIGDQEEQMDEQFQALLEAQAAALKDPEAMEVMARIESMLAEARAVDDAAEAARTDSPEVRYERGQPRDDLARFHGLYGDPSDVGSAAKRLWVSDACGYLTIGATWGDAWPWVMRSISDTAFIAAAVYPGVEPFEAEFRMASDGRAETLTHNGSLAIGNPLPRVGELPEGWDAEPPEGCDHRPR